MKKIILFLAVVGLFGGNQLHGMELRGHQESAIDSDFEDEGEDDFLNLSAFSVDNTTVARSFFDEDDVPMNGRFRKSAGRRVVSGELEDIERRESTLIDLCDDVIQDGIFERRVLTLLGLCEDVILDGIFLFLDVNSVLCVGLVNHDLRKLALYALRLKKLNLDIHRWEFVRYEVERVDRSTLMGLNDKSRLAYKRMLTKSHGRNRSPRYVDDLGLSRRAFASYKKENRRLKRASKSEENTGSKASFRRPKVFLEDRLCVVRNHFDSISLICDLSTPNGYVPIGRLLGKKIVALTLTIRPNHCERYHLGRLAQKLPVLTALTLYTAALPGNEKISDKDLEFVASNVLPCLSSLEKLSINFKGHREVTDTGVMAIARSIRPLTKLWRMNVDLCGTGVTDVGLRAYSESLKVLQQLQYLALNLEGCKLISNDGLIAYCSTFTELPALRLVYLSTGDCPGIDKRGVATCNDILERLSAVSTGWMSLRKGLPTQAALDEIS